MYVLIVMSRMVSSEKRLALLKAVERYDCELLTESAIAIDTSKPAQDLLKEVQESADINQGVYLIPIPDSYDGPAPAKVREWLDRETRHISPHRQ